MVDISKIIRSNRKTLSVSITQNGEVVVKAPLKLSEEEINKFIAEKEKWILSKIGTKTKIQETFDDVINYNKLLIFGKQYPGFYSKTAKKITLMPDRVLIPNKIVSEKLHKKITNWYKSLANDTLISRTQTIAGFVNISPKSVKCTGSRGRWGACNSNNEIFLNWRCIMLPERLLDYVIVHELAHTKELNHSPKFWAVVGQLLPDYKSRRAELKTYSFALKLF